MNIFQVFSLVLITSCGCLVFANICPTDWHRFGESCYFLTTGMMNWREANQSCAESQANLAVPNSQSEQEFMLELILPEFGQSSILWIGCNDIYEEGKWQHCPLKGDDSNGYQNWANNEPNDNMEEDCAVLRAGDAQWNDRPCNFRFLAICELPVSNNAPVFCLQTSNDGRLTSQCLLNHVMKELPGKGVVSCGKACRSDPRCRSFNLLMEHDGAKMVCQLNNATRHEADDTDMADKENCYFYDL